MSQPFPAQPWFSGNYAPILMECDAADLPVVGALPGELRGTLYRNGPNPQYAPRDPYHHWFVGDGMVHAFRIADGRVAYRNRWVRTPKFQLERTAGRSLFGSWGNPLTSDPAVVGKDGGVANTAMLCHGDRLFALEEAHLPVELDPATLDTQGYCDFDGRLKPRMTAHPKIDPATGELVFFAYSVAGPFSRGMLYGTVDRHGAVTRLDRFEAPFASMVHDFMVTERHVLFPILPLTGSLERAMRGKPAYAWEPEKGAHIGVIRRDGAVAEMRWFETGSCYLFHPLNAWEEGTRLCADVMQYEAAPGFPLADGTPGSRAEARLCRWTLDLAGNGNRVERDYIDDLPGEFPRLDERFATRPHRHGYYACSSSGGAGDGSFDTLAHLDKASGTRALFTLPAGDAISEPVFVPRAADSAEGDGWLLAVTYRGAEKRSDLLVFAANALADGPLATAQLSHRVPFGFHGTWRPAR